MPARERLLGECLHASLQEQTATRCRVGRIRYPRLRGLLAVLRRHGHSHHPVPLSNRRRRCPIHRRRSQARTGIHSAHKASHLSHGKMSTRCPTRRRGPLGERVNNYHASVENTSCSWLYFYFSRSPRFFSRSSSLLFWVWCRLPITEN